MFGLFCSTLLAVSEIPIHFLAMKNKDSSQSRVFPETRSVGVFFNLILFELFLLRKRNAGNS